ncbi:integrase, partial [Enterococcus faecium]
PPKRWTTKRNGLQPSQSRIHLIRCVQKKPYP